MGHRRRMKKLEEQQKRLEVDKMKREKRAEEDAAKREKSQERRERREERARKNQEAYDQLSPEEKQKATKLTRVIGAIVAVVILLVVIVSCQGGKDDTSSDAPRATASARKHRTPHPRAASQEKQETQKPAPEKHLAKDVQKSILANSGYKRFTDACGEVNWICVINEVRDTADGVVTVHVQESLSKDEAKDIAKKAFSFAGIDNPDLQWVAVEDTSGGIQGQVQRSEIPILNR